MPSNRALEADVRRSHLRPTSRASRGRSLPLWTSPLLLPRCLTATKFLPLAFRLGVSSLFPSLSLSPSLSPPPIRDSRFYVYKTRRARIDAKRQRCVKRRSRSLLSRIRRYCAPYRTSDLGIAEIQYFVYCYVLSYFLLTVCTDRSALATRI